MGIKTYNPYTPSRRHMTGSDFSEITTSTPEKSLVVSLKKNAGRNNQGKITVRHRGGGSRRKYRIIDFKRRKDGIPATSSFLYLKHTSITSNMPLHTTYISAILNTGKSISEK